MPALREAGPIAKAIGFVACMTMYGGLIGLLVWVWWPLGLAFVGFVAVLMITGQRREGRLAAERSGESICGFARAFDRRAVDSWIIRATYEQLATACGFPIRAEDRLEEDLWIDVEELGFEAMAIAERCGRSLEHAEANPLFDKLETARDLVLFLVLQPPVASRRGAGSQRCSGPVRT